MTTAAVLAENRPGVVVRPELCLRDVAMCLTAGRTGAAVVVRGGRVLGVISERDVVAALAQGGDPDLVWASDVMTPDPVWAEPEDTAEEVLRRMMVAGVRHLPVVADGNLVGVLAMSDVLDEVLRAAGSLPA